MSNIRVVFSIDLTNTFVFGVIGPCASLKGLKLRTAFRIRDDVEGRARTRIDRVLRVASTSRASLGDLKLATDIESNSNHDMLTCYSLVTPQAFDLRDRTPRLLKTELEARDDWEGPCQGKYRADRRATTAVSNAPEKKNLFKRRIVLSVQG